MKHDGLIPSDEADKLYSFPSLPAAGDSDCSEYLCGNGEFNHPHIEYGETKPPFEFTQYSYTLGNYTQWGHIYTDKYGHVKQQKTVRHRYFMPGTATTSAAGLMSAADKTLLDSIASYLAEQRATEG